jgi:hypothetical protein
LAGDTPWFSHWIINDISHRTGSFSLLLNAFVKWMNISDTPFESNMPVLMGLLSIGIS